MGLICLFKKAPCNFLSGVIKGFSAFIVFIFTILILFVSSVSFAADWYDTAWSFRQQITIFSSMTANTDQTDFPVLVKLTAPANQLFKYARPNGDDYNGLEKLDHMLSYTLGICLFNK